MPPFVSLRRGAVVSVVIGCILQKATKKIWVLEDMYVDVRLIDIF